MEGGDTERGPCVVEGDMTGAIRGREIDETGEGGKILRYGAREGYVGRHWGWGGGVAERGRSKGV